MVRGYLVGLICSPFTEMITSGYLYGRTMHNHQLSHELHIVASALEACWMSVTNGFSRISSWWYHCRRVKWVSSSIGSTDFLLEMNSRYVENFFVPTPFKQSPQPFSNTLLPCTYVLAAHICPTLKRGNIQLERRIKSN